VSLAPTPAVDQGSRQLVRGVLEPPTRSSLGGRLFTENFRHPSLTMFNDGSGMASRDTSITFTDGNPSARLDPCTNTNGSQTNPSTGPLTGGVIFKRRVGNLIKGTYAWEGRLRFTSQNNTSNVLTSVSNYNRSGTSAYYSRIWIDTTTGATGTSNPDGSGLPWIQLWYLNSSGVWTAFGTYNSRVSDHSWDPVNNPGKMDEAGIWNYWRLVTNFSTSQIVSFQFNDVVWSSAAFPTLPNGGATQIASIGGQGIYVAADTGARVMHFSVEYSQATATRRFINVAALGAEQLA
jgi:hypothetical protein